MRIRVIAALAAPLLWNNWLLPRLALDRGGRTAAGALAATGYAIALRGRPNWFSARGAGVGIGCAALVAAGYTVASAIPALRRSLSGAGDRAADVSTVEWVAVHIPLGTVYTEELIFRATLDPLLDKEFGTRAGIALGGAAFGLWHIRPALAAGDSVLGTVVFTGAAGSVFGTLRRWTGSATAPALLHWAVNAGGAVLARLNPGRTGPVPVASGRRGRRESDTLRP
ncbi:CPBP family intramembrane metalloprotease [Nocardia speluncae]|uniref:CPBP family intramembrane metalloprotease n=1 Tax=Nocardia speluncae TaxID=419477 RepID=A0A846XKG1_9NOCA|nr:CPBP family intramembrane glutamic endopeptidase [Nocardia speluncae]NKY35815.1 CPBP family intramembrane metalloprotease [Nocardia speluncae]